MGSNPTLSAITFVIWREGTKRVRVSVGKNAVDASARRQRKEAELNARNNGVGIVLDSGDRNGHNSLSVVVADYLADVKLTHKPRSYAAYRTALEYFLESCNKPHVTHIDRRDLLKFLKAQGIRGLVGKKDWPR